MKATTSKIKITLSKTKLAFKITIAQIKLHELQPSKIYVDHT